MLAEFIKAGSRTYCCETCKRITSIWNKEELLEEWKESNNLPIKKKKAKNNIITNYRGISLLPSTYKNVSNNLINSICRGHYSG